MKWESCVLTLRPILQGNPTIIAQAEHSAGLERAPEREVQATATGEFMLALGQSGYTMEGESATTTSP